MNETLKQAGLGVLKVIGYALVALFVFASALEIFGTWNDEWSGYNASTLMSDGICNIAVIPIHGSILAYENEYGSSDDSESTSPEDIRFLLNMAESDPLIKGVLYRIDSYGGSPAGGEAIHDRIQSSSLPSIALVGDSALSAGYLIASGIETIIASELSNIGSIGVTMSYLENVTQNEYDGLEFVSLSSGKFKDPGSPDKHLTAEERELFERDLQISHDYFVSLVARNREMTREEVEEIADGSSMPGRLALEKKLIDVLGNRDTVSEKFSEKLSLPTTDTVFCE